MLNGKVAIVTGASNGIGKAIAELFFKNGATVIGTYNNTEVKSNEIDYYKLDITDYKAVEEFFNIVKEKYKKIDILVNNAGINKDSLTCNMSYEDFDVVMKTNVYGTFYLTKFVGPLMQENNYGSIINISSIAGIEGNIGQANYSASKSAIIGLTHTWAKEFSMHNKNVRVNAIAPGLTNTKMISNMKEEILDKFTNKILLGRIAQTSDIASLALFLASDDASYITNEVIKIDGGLKL